MITIIKTIILDNNKHNSNHVDNSGDLNFTSLKKGKTFKIEK